MAARLPAVLRPARRLRTARLPAVLRSEAPRPEVHSPAARPAAPRRAALPPADFPGAARRRVPPMGAHRRQTAEAGLRMAGVRRMG
ncbi:hypothetical protein AALC17_17530 [Oscillospiraceae bacterium 38-13]